MIFLISIRNKERFFQYPKLKYIVYKLNQNYDVDTFELYMCGKYKFIITKLYSNAVILKTSSDQNHFIQRQFNSVYIINY